MFDTPKRPESHVIGDVGQASVALQFKRWGWTADLIVSDYGEDLVCDIYSNNHRTSFGFRCQVKSTSSNKGQVRKLKGGNFSISISISTCIHWANSYYPIIIAVYDDITDQTHWKIINTEAKEKIVGLRKKSVTFRIEQNKLASSKEELERNIVQFYTSLLSLESPLFKCDLIPVLMPKYRSLNAIDLIKHISDVQSERTKFETKKYSYEVMPTWITTIKSLNGESIAGWTVKSNVDSLADFFNDMTNILIQINLPKKESEWLSFVVSPIELCEKNSELSPHIPFWNKQLTYWSCYNVIGGTCNLDDEHTFELPSSFIKQVARRSGSWDGFDSLDNEYDLSVQIIAGSITTPVYKESVYNHKKQIIGKFKPWLCETDKISCLNELLSSVGLLFRIVESESLITDVDFLLGIICVPMFAPDIGMIPQTEEWDEFEVGAVEYILKNTGLLDVIPGKEGPDEITSRVLNFFGSINTPILDDVSISESEHISGHPINLEKRQIIFSRVIQKQQDAQCSFILLNDDLKAFVSYHMQREASNLEVYVESFDSYGGEITCISVILSPPLGVSSSKMILEKRKIISEILDEYLFPIKMHISHYRTEDILRDVGQLYFEGDGPWSAY